MPPNAICFICFTLKLLAAGLGQLGLLKLVEMLAMFLHLCILEQLCSRVAMPCVHIASCALVSQSSMRHKLLEVPQNSMPIPVAKMLMLSQLVASSTSIIGAWPSHHQE